MAIRIEKDCEYKGQYLEYDDEDGEYDVIKCSLFYNNEVYDDGYCDSDTDKENCILYKYIKKVVEKKENK